MAKKVYTQTEIDEAKKELLELMETTPRYIPPLLGYMRTWTKGPDKTDDELRLNDLNAQLISHKSSLSDSLPEVAKNAINDVIVKLEAEIKTLESKGVIDTERIKDRIRTLANRVNKYNVSIAKKRDAGKKVNKDIERANAAWAEFSDMTQKYPTLVSDSIKNTELSI
jgi:chromosome segregation ATPase